MVTRSDCHFKFKETERLGDSKSSRERNNDERVSLLYSAWSSVLNEPTSGGKEHLQKHGISYYQSNKYSYGYSADKKKCSNS